MAYFVVSKQSHLDILKTIFKDRICTQNTLSRYNKFYNTQLTQLQLPTFNDSWFSGFIDAEGCFRIKFEKNDTVKLIFELTQKDSYLIYNCRNLFTSLLGNVRFDRCVYKLSFSGKVSRLELINYLKKYPLVSHKRIVLHK